MQKTRQKLFLFSDTIKRITLYCTRYKNALITRPCVRLLRTHVRNEFVFLLFSFFYVVHCGHVCVCVCVCMCIVYAYALCSAAANSVYDRQRLRTRARDVALALILYKIISCCTPPYVCVSYSLIETCV